MTPDLLTRLFAILGLLVFAAGSAYVALAIIGVGADPRFPKDYTEGVGFIFALVWSLVLLAVGALGAVALPRTRGPASIPYLLLALGGIYMVVQAAIYVIGLFNEWVYGTGSMPWRVSIVLIALLFLALNGVVIYLAWRYILRTET